MSARSRIALAAVAVALAGLFAMHGMSPHGTTHSSPSTPETAVVHAGHGPDLSAGQPADGGEGDALLALCLALLVTGVVGLVGRGRPIRTAVRDAIRPDPLTPAATARRYRDPPDLHALSILRC